jgi:tripartite-type tricarboxylate transporter receptor subunit TctC
MQQTCPTGPSWAISGLMRRKTSFPARTVPEFIAYAKANPGKLNFGSAGIGSVAHMGGELFKAMAGVNLVHVPYTGLAPALNDLLAGQVQAVFSTIPPAMGPHHIRRVPWR